MKNKLANNAEVAHYWANKIQSSGRGSSFFFEYGELYSYGHHFMVAKHAAHAKDGRPIVLFTERTYSNSTARHVGLARAACNHLEVVYCYDPASSPENNMRVFIADAQTVADKLRRARKPLMYAERLEQLEAQATAYAEAVGIEVPDALKLMTSIRTGDQYVKAIDAARAAEKKREQREKASRRRRFKTALVKWLNGEAQYLRLRNPDERRDYLRRRNARVETSQGVTMSIPQARRLYEMIRDGELTAGARVLDGYAVTECTDDVTVIGCHTFPTAYLLRFGAELPAIGIVPAS